MISKKITAGVMITLAAFSLAACQNSSKSSSTSSAPKSSQVKKTTLKASDLTAQQNASAITYYAAQTYGGRWKKTWNAAKKDGLSFLFAIGMLSPLLTREKVMYITLLLSANQVKLTTL